MKVPLARTMVTCGRELWFKCQSVTDLPSCVTVDRPSHLPFFHFFIWLLSPDASVVGCVPVLPILLFQGRFDDVVNPPTAQMPEGAGSVYPCRTASFLEQIFLVCWSGKWWCWSSWQFESPWWPGRNGLALVSHTSLPSSLDQGQQATASEPNLATMGSVNETALERSRAYSPPCCVWLLSCCNSRVEQQ